MRTKYCKKIGEAQCLGTAMITIRKRSYIIHSIIDIKCTSKKDLDEFAILDGFTSWAELMKFWIEEHGPTCFPFTGTIIYFNLLSKKHWKKPGTHTKFRKLLKEQFHG